MGVIERALEIHYSTFPRAPRDGLSHPFGAIAHEPYRWRVSQDVWDELTALRPVYIPDGTRPMLEDRLVGEPIIIDDDLPPKSMVLEPSSAGEPEPQDCASCGHAWVAHTTVTNDGCQVEGCLCDTEVPGYLPRWLPKPSKTPFPRTDQGKWYRIPDSNRPPHG